VVVGAGMEVAAACRSSREGMEVLRALGVALVLLHRMQEGMGAVGSISSSREGLARLGSSSSIISSHSMLVTCKHGLPACVVAGMVLC
jgi:hypothetical protein